MYFQKPNNQLCSKKIDISNNKDNYAKFLVKRTRSEIIMSRLYETHLKTLMNVNVTLNYEISRLLSGKIVKQIENIKIMEGDNSHHLLTDGKVNG